MPYEPGPDGEHDLTVRLVQEPGRPVRVLFEGSAGTVGDLSLADARTLVGALPDHEPPPDLPDLAARVEADLPLSLLEKLCCMGAHEQFELGEATGDLLAVAV